MEEVLAAYSHPHGAGESPTVQLGRLLALADAECLDEVALARRVAAGLPVAAVAALAGLLGRSRVIGPIISEATVRRHRKSRTPLSRRHSERVYELGRVIDVVGRAFHGDAARISAFLDRPHPLLGGATPYDMAVSCSAGADAVVNLVHRAEAGVAV